MFCFSLVTSLVNICLFQSSSASRIVCNTEHNLWQCRGICCWESYRWPHRIHCTHCRYAHSLTERGLPVCSRLGVILKRMGECMWTRCFDKDAEFIIRGEIYLRLVLCRVTGCWQFHQLLCHLPHATFVLTKHIKVKLLFI